MNCRYCNKECKNNNSLRNHERVCKENPNKTEIKGYIAPWTDERRQKHSLVMKEKNTNLQRTLSKEGRLKISKNSTKHNSKYWTEENKRKHSKIMKEIVKKSPESYSSKNVCGRTKLHETIDSFNNETKLNGKWELEVASWLNSQKIKWTNIIKVGFDYIWNDSKRLYFPDFYLPDYNLYIEVKGYEREQDRCKWKVVENLIVLKGKEIRRIRKENVVIEDFFKFFSLQSE